MSNYAEEGMLEEEVAGIRFAHLDWREVSACGCGRAGGGGWRRRHLFHGKEVRVGEKKEARGGEGESGAGGIEGGLGPRGSWPWILAARPLPLAREEEGGGSARRLLQAVAPPAPHAGKKEEGSSQQTLEGFGEEEEGVPAAVPGSAGGKAAVLRAGRGWRAREEGGGWRADGKREGKR